MNGINIGLVKIDNGYEGSVTLPYAMGLIQAYYLVNGKNNANVSFLEPIFLRCPVEEAVEKLLCSDIVMFSVYSWNLCISLAIAKRLKEVSPNVLIVFGGPMIPPPDAISYSSRVVDFLEKHSCVDIVCHGEGERTSTHIIDGFATKDWEDIPFISYLSKTGNKIAVDSYRETDLDSLPSPYLLGLFDSLLEKYANYRWVALWETNRGCPFSCAYCAWGMGKKKMYQFNMDRAKEELEWLSKHKIAHISNCDANFGVFERDVDFAEHVASLHETTGYPVTFAFFAAKNDPERVLKIHEILKEFNMVSGTSLALQSVSPIVLKNIGRDNISTKYFSQMQEYCIENNISITTDLIMGLPGETYDSFTHGVETIIENGQFNKINFFPLGVLENSKMISPEYIKKFGIKTVISKFSLRVSTSIDQGIQEFTEMVIATDSMPAEEWRKTYAWMSMCSFLFFSGLLQIPLTVLKWKAKIPLSRMVSAFFISDKRFPLFSELSEKFLSTAALMQSGEPYLHFSKEYLNRRWEPNNYLHIKIIDENQIDTFYKECQMILEEVISSYSKVDTYKDILSDSIALNKIMLKTPSDTVKDSITLDYNIFEYYKSIKSGKIVSLEKINTKYNIIRDTKFNNIDDWLKKLVLHKTSPKYLWDVQSSANTDDSLK